MKVKNIRK